MPIDQQQVDIMKVFDAHKKNSVKCFQCWKNTLKINILKKSDNTQKNIIVKLRQGSGKDRQGMAVKAKGLKA